jgi:hypothetical protein
VGVDIYCGWHGNGKTYCAVEHCLRVSERTGSELVTNANVTGSTHFDTWDELYQHLERATTERLAVQLLIDEGGKFLSNRFWQKLDPRTLTMLQERRKIGRGVDLIVTVPHFRHIDPQLRDVAQKVHLCKRVGGTEYSHDGGRPPRFFIVRSYRPEQLTTDGSRMVRRKEKPLSRRIVPFSRDLAALYGTAVLDMSKPMLSGDRPDYRDAAAEPPAPVAVKLEVLQGKKRRGSK